MSVADSPPLMIEHALLLPLGRFARQIGLLAALDRIPIAMKTVDHSPGDKLAELFAHILAGGMHVTELERSPHPLVSDTAVAQAFGQEAFASASGVNALLRAVDPASVAALTAALQQVLAPYRQRLLRDLVPALVEVDFDLTGLVISDQAVTYQGADWGYMGELGKVGKGYQFARAQLNTRAGALVLGGFLHSGRTVSLACLAELVTLVEATVGRPRRRVELIEQRLVQVEQQLAAVEQALVKGATGRRQERVQTRQAALQAERAQLQTRHEAMTAENAGHPNARRILLRLDGGFGDVAHLAWLEEQGYDFIARAHHRVASCLRTEENLAWEKVSKNGFIAESRQTSIRNAPYPLRVFACRQWWGDDKAERWSALLVNQELDGTDWPTRRVGVFYNGRQVIEAGIKEGKGIFASRHLPTRHLAGIALYQELVLAAQNLLRWFQRQVLHHSSLSATGIKDLVRRAANSRALAQVHGRALVLHFAAENSWPDQTLALPMDLTYQLCLPILDLGGNAGP